MLPCALGVFFSSAGGSLSSPRENDGAIHTTKLPTPPLFAPSLPRSQLTLSSYLEFLRFTMLTQLTYGLQPLLRGMGLGIPNTDRSQRAANTSAAKRTALATADTAGRLTTKRSPNENNMHLVHTAIRRPELEQPL